MPPVSSRGRIKALLLEIHIVDEQVPLVGACLKAYAQRHPLVRDRAEIRIASFTRWSAAAEKILSFVLDADPDVLGLPCYLWNLDVALAVAAGFKAAKPDATLVLGGPEVAPRAEETLRRNPAVDIVVCGEGEETFLELMLHFLGAGKPLADIAGLAYRDRGISRTGERPLLDPERLVSPYLSDLPELDREFAFAALETSRGCPFDCKFCDWGTNQKVRWHALDRTLRELEWLAARAASIYLTDSDIFLDRARAFRLLRAFRPLAERRPVRLSLDVNPIFLDEASIEALDCSQIMIGCGVQSIDPAVLDGVTRAQNFRRLDANMDRLMRLAPRAKTNIHIIYGLPGDTLDGFTRSIDWELSKRPSQPGANQALVLPGSGMGLHPERYGIEYEEDPPHRVLRTTGFSKDELLEASRIAAYMRAFALDSAIRGVLDAIAASRSGADKPFFSTYSAFYRFLCRSGEEPFLRLRDAREFDEPGKVTGGWSLEATLRRFELADPGVNDRLLDRLVRFAAAECEGLGLSGLLPGLEAGIREGYRRNHWRRNSGGLRGLLEAALRSCPVAFAGSRRTLLIGSGIIRWLDPGPWRGEDAVVMELEPVSGAEFTTFHAPFVATGLRELASRSWEEPFDTIIVAPVYLDLALELRRALSAAIAGWLKPRGRLLLLDADGPGDEPAALPLNRFLAGSAPGGRSAPLLETAGWRVYLREAPLPVGA